MNENNINNEINEINIEKKDEKKEIENIIYNAESNLNSKIEPRTPVIENVTEFTSKSRLYNPKHEKKKTYKYKSVKSTLYGNKDNDSDTSSSSYSQKNSKKSNKNIKKMRFYLFYFMLCLSFVYLLIYLVKFDKILEKNTLTIDIFYLLLLLFLLNVMLILSLNSSCLIYLTEIFIEITIAVYIYLLIKAVKDGILQREITEKIFYMQMLIFFMFIVFYFKN